MVALTKSYSTLETCHCRPLGTHAGDTYKNYKDAVFLLLGTFLPCVNKEVNACIDSAKPVHTTVHVSDIVFCLLTIKCCKDNWLQAHNDTHQLVTHKHHLKTLMKDLYCTWYRQIQATLGIAPQNQLMHSSALYFWSIQFAAYIKENPEAANMNNCQSLRNLSMNNKKKQGTAKKKQKLMLLEF